jgi:hypothetical protein
MIRLQLLAVGCMSPHAVVILAHPLALLSQPLRMPDCSILDNIFSVRGAFELPKARMLLPIQLLFPNARGTASSMLHEATLYRSALECVLHDVVVMGVTLGVHATPLGVSLPQTRQVHHLFCYRKVLRVG